MTQTTKEIGGHGEAMARELLIAKGYAIVQTNAVVGRVEVDIIAQNAHRIVFVEVKTRRDDHLDDNFAIDSTKLQRISRAADTYIRSRNLPHEAQIDAILITNHPDGTSSIDHLEDIYLPPLRRR